MTDVTIRSEDDPDASMTIGTPLETEADFHILPLTITAPSLSVSRDVLTHRGGALGRFIEDVAES